VVQFVEKRVPAADAAAGTVGRYAAGDIVERKRKLLL
jgi:hypothetical protein